jgi:histidyl-tRNA synthetase
MRDFLPADKAKRDRVLEVIRRTYSARGFDEIETPVMEESERLHAGLGGDNEKLAFAVMKRGITPETLAEATDPLDLADLGLRFDLTVPLARFYASHRGELPAVFRSIQIAPVWRAERPQKGRYRQFVQCDIDIIGESGPIAEVELLTATAATLDALGLEGCTIRVNDRRLLTSALMILGFPAKEHDAVLITLDKLDKIGQDGVIAELRERAFPDGPVDALEAFFRRPTTMEFLPFGEAAIRKFLPEGVDAAAVAALAEIGLAVEAARAAAPRSAAGTPLIEFDPWLVRGMGYYTGAIFEVVHPSLGYSLGGGGRYDNMIGRFLGTDVPAAGFSFGFERVVELVSPAPSAGDADSVALLHDPAAEPAALAALQSQLIATGRRVRLVKQPRNLAPLLEQLSQSGFASYAVVTDSSTPDSLEFKALR